MERFFSPSNETTETENYFFLNTALAKTKYLSFGMLSFIKTMSLYIRQHKPKSMYVMVNTAGQ